ncbi:protein jagged-1-like isoform X1 [Haliotis rufescens]|uniref:protein jagged-1-like isoform X1 n=1 Tax=Haliotis rufescens TaxID=6454 RepID=UPI00201F94C8|nr:protein jagged-1-like isoform X1 [Haliotis rufescens]
MGRTLFLMCLVCLTQVTSGKGRATVHFIKYSNPSGKDAGGECCEGVFNCKDLCDPLFRVCYKELPSSTEKCPIETGSYENTNQIHFGKSIGGNTNNPVSFDFDHFDTSLRIEVNAQDHDTGFLFGSNDNIETVHYDVAAALTFNSTLPGTSITMKGNVITFEATVQVKCYDHYYGNGCGTYCRAEDDPGHYICDPAGKRVCLDKWIGAKCDQWDYCFNSTCQNSATCRNNPRDYSCLCKSRYTGAFCEALIPTTTMTTPSKTSPTTTTATTSTISTTVSPTTTAATTTTQQTEPTSARLNRVHLSHVPVKQGDNALPIVLTLCGVLSIVPLTGLAVLFRRKCSSRVKPVPQDRKLRTKAQYNTRPPLHWVR